MIIHGIPPAGTNPVFNRSKFYTYCPKLKEWVADPQNNTAYKEFVKICNSKISYAYYADDWDYAMSLAIAHYICITNPDYVQAIGADTTVGGVMSSRSVGGVSYTYDLDKTMNDNQAYKFWQRTGYGNQLINLSASKGWIGILVLG